MNPMKWLGSRYVKHCVAVADRERDIVQELMRAQARNAYTAVAHRPRRGTVRIEVLDDNVSAHVRFPIIVEMDGKILQRALWEHFNNVCDG